MKGSCLVAPLCMTHRPVKMDEVFSNMKVVILDI